MPATRRLLELWQQKSHDSAADSRWALDSRAPKFLSLNVRTLRKQINVLGVQDLVQRFRPWVLCVQESKVASEADLKLLQKSFPQAQVYAALAPSSSSAGVVPQGHTDPQGCWVRLNCRIQDTLFTVLNVYLPPGDGERKQRALLTLSPPCCRWRRCMRQ